MGKTQKHRITPQRQDEQLLLEMMEKYAVLFNNKKRKKMWRVLSNDINMKKYNAEKLARIWSSLRDRHNGICLRGSRTEEEEKLTEKLNFLDPESFLRPEYKKFCPGTPPIPPKRAPEPYRISADTSKVLRSMTRTGLVVPNHVEVVEEKTKKVQIITRVVQTPKQTTQPQTEENQNANQMSTVKSGKTNEQDPLPLPIENHVNLTSSQIVNEQEQGPSGMPVMNVTKTINKNTTPINTKNKRSISGIKREAVTEKHLPIKTKTNNTEENSTSRKEIETNTYGNDHSENITQKSNQIKCEEIVTEQVSNSPQIIKQDMKVVISQPSATKKVTLSSQQELAIDLFCESMGATVQTFPEELIKEVKAKINAVINVMKHRTGDNGSISQIGLGTKVE